MNTLFAGAYAVGVLAVTTRLANRHAQVIDKDIHGKTSDLARLFALRESIEEFPLPLQPELTSLRSNAFNSRPSVF